VALTVIKLRKTAPDVPGSFSIPGGITVPAAATIVIVWFLAHLTGQEAFGMAVLVAVLSILFLGMKLLRR
jgi:hypothetical protein